VQRCDHLAAFRPPGRSQAPISPPIGIQGAESGVLRTGDDVQIGQCGPIDQPQIVIRSGHSGFLGRVSSDFGGSRIESAAPVVLGHFPAQAGRVRNQFEFKRNSGFEGVFGQHPLAEPVDGKNAGAVEIPHGLLEIPYGSTMIGDSPQQRSEKRIGTGAGGKGLPGFDQTAADASLQLFGGRPGIGDHQDAVHGPLLLDNQADEKTRNRIGLAGTGTGFD